MFCTSSICCDIASGDTGVTLISKPLTRNGKSIKPRSSITCRILPTNGIIVSLIKRPNAEPKFCDSCFIRSITSVAERADMLSGGNDSSSKIDLMFIRKSFIIICDTLKSPERGNGFSDSPCGPPLRATGIITPGAICTVLGLSTPSSAAVYTPAIANDAFLSTNSSTLFSVLISGNAVISGPRP